MNMKCECEHKAHFGEGLTPNTNPGHKYGVEFNTHYIDTVLTNRGTFHICKDCAKDCHAHSDR